jgi:hypothetical protein
MPGWAKHGLTKSIRTFARHEANLFEHNQLTQHRRLGLTKRTHEFRNAYPTTVRFREQIQQSKVIETDAMVYAQLVVKLELQAGVGTV